MGAINDAKCVSDFFKAVDIVTLENEFNDAQSLIQISSKLATPIFPDPSKFLLIEDKLSEKQFFQSLGIDIAEYSEITDFTHIPDVAGYLKLAKGGYDGIGTVRVENQQQAEPIFEKLKEVGTVLFERAVNYKKELSLIAVSDGEKIVFYPMVETHQEQGTCLYVSYPAGVDSSIEEKAQGYVERIINQLDTKGLFAFEFFLTHDDHLILNESAPRPHNSGHITLDLVDCSQFENHMRAVAGLALVEPKIIADSMTMLNLLATKNDRFDSSKLLEKIDDSESNTTFYQKNHSRVKRKMGHVNLWGDNQRQRAERIIETINI